MRAIGWILLTVAVVFVAAPRAVKADLTDALRLYARGQHDVAVSTALQAVRAEAALSLLADRHVAWLADDGLGPDVGRRRLVVASFTVEIAATPAPVQGSVSAVEWRDALIAHRRLVAWAGAVLTGAAGSQPDTERRLKELPAPVGPVGRGEREWFDAAITAMRLNGWGGLIDLPPDALESARTYPLLALAQTRFPKAPWIEMARAAAEEFYGWGGLGATIFVTSPLNNARMMTRADVVSEVLGTTSRNAADRDRFRRAALTRYEALAADPTLAADARLRAGYLRLINGEDDKAIQHLVHAATLDRDTRFQFVSQVLVGFAHERRRRLSDAEKSYRTALALVPQARSASALLSMLLVGTDRSAEARTLAPALLILPGSGHDPWDDFVLGPRPSWPQARAALRASLERRLP